MIGRLRGAVAEVGEEEALIDVGGVGYVVRCGSRTLSHLPALGDETLLHVETQWTESAGMRLYGFSTREERRAFVLLQNIQGVGPAGGLVGAGRRCRRPNWPRRWRARTRLAAWPRQGVGPNLAQRIVTELKDKPISDGPVAAFHAGAARAPAPPSIAGEAVAALMGLGVAEAVGRRTVDAGGAAPG